MFFKKWINSRWGNSFLFPARMCGGRGWLTPLKTFRNITQNNWRTGCNDGSTENGSNDSGVGARRHNTEEIHFQHDDRPENTLVSFGPLTSACVKAESLSADSPKAARMNGSDFHRLVRRGWFLFIMCWLRDSEHQLRALKGYLASSL